jgi:anion-transporting  ArsA/GET3 family ATPase
MAAAIAVHEAISGKRVLVLTIDPSKRLAQTLGIEGEKDIIKVPGQNYKGVLYASIVDHKKTFDDFVIRAAKKSESVQKILDNSLYKQLSTNLSGSQDFTSLEKLYTCYESGDYDLIILDTPPTKHAIDFLNAPQKLSALFNESVGKWFQNPEDKKYNFINQFIQTGTKQVLKILETLTGSQFIKELGDFFLNIEKWQDKLLQRTVDVQRMLIAPTTKFALITSFDQAKLKEAEYFSKEIKKGGYHLDTVILNRMFPLWLDVADFEKFNEVDFSEKDRKLFEVFKETQSFYLNRNKAYEKFAEKMDSDIRVFRIAELERDVFGLPGLEDLSQYLDEKLRSI